MGSRKKEPPSVAGPRTAIGIDLGSSKCCVGLVRDGKAEVLENERGNKTTPSYVAFTEAERLVGESARDQVTLNPTNTVFGAKTLLGRKGETKDTIEGLTKHLPYDVTQENGGIRIKVMYKGMEKKLSPEQIAAMLLSHMKKLAEGHLGRPVQQAVIAVPSHFNNAQRRAVKDAGAIAGLTVLGLISETAAAAMAYQDGKSFAKKQNVLVVDIGGGAFNAAVVEVQDTSVEVRAVCGSTDLSGTELDQLLVDHLANKFTQLNRTDIKGNKKALKRLRIACQKAKHMLTLLPETVAQVDCLVGEKDFSYKVTRSEFNQKILPGAQETIEKVIKTVLSDAKLSPPDVDEVVLVGGTTLVTGVQEALVKLFAGKHLNKTINPDEAVAHGAALQAAILAGDNSLAEVRVTDIVKNPVKIPPLLRKSITFEPFLTVPSEGCEYRIYYEWFHIRSKKNTLNHFLDSFGIYSPKGHKALGSSFVKSHIDVSMILKYLTDKEVSAMAQELQEFDKQDEEYRQLIHSVSDLESLCFSVKGALSCDEGNQEAVNVVAASDRSKALEYCDETLDWLDQDELATKKDYENRWKKLKILFEKASIKKSKESNKDVDENIEVQLANGIAPVKIEEASKTLPRNEGVPPSNQTGPSEPTPVSALMEPPGFNQEFKAVEVPATATANKSTSLGVSHTDDRATEITAGTCEDATPQILQSGSLDYRDATVETKAIKATPQILQSGALDYRDPTVETKAIKATPQILQSGALDHRDATVETKAIKATPQGLQSGALDHRDATVETKAIKATLQGLQSGALDHRDATVETKAIKATPQGLQSGALDYRDPMAEAMLANNMVKSYIDYRHFVIRNWNQPYYPMFRCFFCYYYPYPMQIHRRLMNVLFQHLPHCAILPCEDHAYLLYPPHYS